MRFLRAWASRVASLVTAARREEDFSAEIESHLQMHTDDNLRAGMSPAEARRAALLQLGGIEGLKERQRDQAGVPLLRHLWRDVRYSARTLRRNPAFATVTIVTLALGIGATTAIFTLVNAVLLRPLPYAEGDRLALIWSTDEARGSREVSASYPVFEAWRDDTRSLEGIAALTSRAVTLGGAEQPELVPAIQTTADFFRVLHVDALMGRVFSNIDALPGASPAAVLSDTAWKRQFGGRSDIIGATVTVNQRPHVVIGVVPATMHFIPTEVEQVYTLLPRETNRAHGYLRVLARLRPDVSFDEAQAELNVLSGRIAAAFPRTDANTGANLVPLAAAVGAPLRDGLLILLALVGAVLLIACTNVANLLLARNASRQHELGLRVSLGAGRPQIFQQLVTESLLLAFAGGAAGLVLAHILTDGLVAMLADGIPVPRLETVGIDRTVLGFAFGTALATGLLFGVGPAMIAVPRRLSASAREAGRSIAGGRGGRRTRATLVVVETAVALVLLAAGAILGRSFIELRGTSSGFVADDVLVVAVRLPATLAPGAPRAAFFEEVRARVESLPRVRSAAFVSNLPMAGARDTLQFHLHGQPGAKALSANFNIATPGYFRTMSVPVSAGREFTPADAASAPAAVVINETAARRFWPGINPIGRQIALAGRPIAFTVVGVTGDVRQSDLGTAPRPEIFLSGLQNGPDWPTFALVVGASSDPLSLAADVRTSLRAVDPDVAIARVATMEEVVAGRLAQPRIYTTLLGAFAVLALVLAAVGLYGVMAYSVTQRTRELGVRLALGSTPGAVMALMLKQGAALTAAGILTGIAGAHLMAQWVATLLPGARAGDRLTLVAVAAAMLLVGCAASYIPARRAAGVDPLVALRAE